MSFSQGGTGKDSAQISAAGITGSAEPTPSDGKHEPETITISLPALRATILTTLDDQTWLLYEQVYQDRVLWDESRANEERLRLCDEIERRLRKLQ